MTFYLRHGPLHHVLYARRGKAAVNEADTLRFRDSAQALPQILDFIRQRSDPGDAPPETVIARLTLPAIILQEFSETYRHDQNQQLNSCDAREVAAINARLTIHPETHR